jgi:hypothetical protein
VKRDRGWFFSPARLVIFSACRVAFPNQDELFGRFVA